MQKQTCCMDKVVCSQPWAVVDACCTDVAGGQAGDVDYASSDAEAGPGAGDGMDANSQAMDQASQPGYHAQDKRGMPTGSIEDIVFDNLRTELDDAYAVEAEHPLLAMNATQPHCKLIQIHMSLYGSASTG